MNKRTEQEQQVCEVVVFCETNQPELKKYPTKAKKLNYLYDQLKNISPEIVLKGFARFLKNNVLPLDQQMEIARKKMQEKMDGQIAAMPFTEAEARAMIGKRVVLTAKNLSGEAYEVKGTMVDVKPYAQYPWALHIRKLRARKVISIFSPEPLTILGLREAK